MAKLNTLKISHNKFWPILYFGAKFNFTILSEEMSLCVNLHQLKCSLNNYQLSYENKQINPTQPYDFW